MTLIRQGLRKVRRNIITEKVLLFLPPPPKVGKNCTLSGALVTTVRFTDHYNIATICPPPLCRDNGVRIAWNGLKRWRAKKGIVEFSHALDVGVETTLLVEDRHPLIAKAAIK